MINIKDNNGICTEYSFQYYDTIDQDNGDNNKTIDYQANTKTNLHISDNVARNINTDISFILRFQMKIPKTMGVLM